MCHVLIIEDELLVAMDLESLLEREGATLFAFALSQGDVSTLGLGCMGMSEFYAGPDKGKSMATTDLALERGVTLFDTADMYGVDQLAACECSPVLSLRSL